MARKGQPDRSESPGTACAQAATSQLRCLQVTGAGTGVCWVPGLTPQGTSFPRGWLASREAPWQPLQTGQGGDTLHPGLPCTDATGDRSIRAPLPDDRLGLPDSVSRGEAGDTPGSKEARVQRDPRAVSTSARVPSRHGPWTQMLSPGTSAQGGRGIWARTTLSSVLKYARVRAKVTSSACLGLQMLWGNDAHVCVCVHAHVHLGAPLAAEAHVDTHGHT